MVLEADFFGKLGSAGGADDALVSMLCLDVFVEMPLVALLKGLGTVGASVRLGVMLPGLVSVGLELTRFDTFYTEFRIIVFELACWAVGKAT